MLDQVNRSDRMACTARTAISGHRAATRRPMPDRPIQRAIGSGLGMHTHDAGFGCILWWRNVNYGHRGHTPTPAQCIS